MKKISTTIKKEHMNKILNGSKKIEYKGDTNHWHKRLVKLEYNLEDVIIINFLCGRKSYKYHVTDITRCFSQQGILIDDKFHLSWWEITLGKKYIEEKRLG